MNYQAFTNDSLTMMYEGGLLRRWHYRDNPSLWATGSVFLDGPDHAEKS
jgi:hypothetical protein